MRDLLRTESLHVGNQSDDPPLFRTRGVVYGEDLADWILVGEIAARRGSPFIFVLSDVTIYMCN